MKTAVIYALDAKQEHGNIISFEREWTLPFVRMRQKFYAALGNDP